MAAKKRQVVDKDTNIISDVEETVVTFNPGGVVEEVKAPEKREPGTIIKTYVQNGLGYKRVVQDDGISTVDMRG